MVTAETWSSASATSCIHCNTAPWGLGLRSSETTLVSSKYICSAQRLGLAPASLAPGGHANLRARLVRQQQFFQRRPGRCLQPAPLVCRHQNGCFGAALGHHLRTFCQAPFEELAEPRLGILHRP